MCCTGRTSADRFRGRLVLIGTSAIGLLDIKTTAVEPAMPGVEVHAQILENALTKALLARPNYAIGAELVAAVAFGLAIIIAAPMLPASIVVALGAVLIASLVGLSWYFFVAHSLLIDFTYPLMSCWLIYLVLTFVNYFREQRQRQQIRSAFGFYLSPHMVEQLASSPDKLVLGGEERRMTILFSDVRGFTTISEHYKDDPQGLTRLMNRFLTPMTNAIIERKGTIDKYIGDAIMAFWNAPLDDSDQEANACDAALEMLARAEALNGEFKREAEESGGAYMPLRIGIGLNTGPCVVGNMGSDFRFNYSVLGDTVNRRVAARGANQGLSAAAGDRLAHRGSGQAEIRHDGDRSDPSEGQKAARGGVYRARACRSRAGSAVPGIARAQCAACWLATASRNGTRRRACSIAAASSPTASMWRDSTTCMPSASRRTAPTRRRRTGTASTKRKRST